MSETITRQNAEVPLSFPYTTTELIGDIRALTFKTRHISRELSNLDNLVEINGEVIPEAMKTDKKSELEDEKEDLRSEIANRHKKLYFDIKEPQEKFSNDQNIFLYSVFRNLSVSDGVDFTEVDESLTHFRRLIPGTTVRLWDQNDRFSGSEVPSKHTLTQFPAVKLEFHEIDNEGLSISALVTYVFADQSDPVIHSWHHYDVEIIG
jgi:hypothetical protein